MGGNSGQKEAARIQAQATKEAALIQQQSTREQLALQEKLYGRQEEYLKEEQGYNRGITAQNQANAQPWINSGLKGLKEYNRSALDENSWMNRKFTQADMDDDAGYQFRQQQGNNALNASLAASSGLLSGAALKAAANYNQGLASNEYQNAYGRFADQRNNRLNNLNNLTNFGITGNQLYQSGSSRDTGGSALAGAASNYSGQSSNTIAQGANNQANNVLSGAQQQAQYLLNKQSPWGAIGTIAGGAIGGFFGGPAGATAGASIGGSVGKMI